MVENTANSSPSSLIPTEEESVLSSEEESKKSISARQLQYSIVRHSSPLLDDVSYSVTVTFGSPLPKKWSESKLHPTYETTITIKNCQKSHKVLHFFHTYRALFLSLQSMGVGENLSYPIHCEFPPTYIWSSFGFQMPPEKLEERCSMLNRWMQALLKKFHKYPIQIQMAISDFFSLHDGNEEKEKNKNEILTMIKNRKASKRKHRSKSKSGSRSPLERSKSENSPAPPSELWNTSISHTVSTLERIVIDQALESSEPT